MLLIDKVQIAISMKPKVVASALLAENLVAHPGKVEFMLLAKFSSMGRIPPPTSTCTSGRTNLRFFGENQKKMKFLFDMSTYLS
jgi:hypothetical protein